MTRMMSTSFRLGVAETACQVGLLSVDSIRACPRGNITALRLQDFSEKIVSSKMCVEIFLKIFKVYKSVLFLFLKRQWEPP